MLARIAYPALARRLFLLLELVVAGSAVALSLAAGIAIERGSAAWGLVLIAMVAVSGLVILLSLPVEIVFLSWLVLAPLLQNSADSTAIGRPLVLGLYIGPTLVLVLWTLTQRAARRFTIIDVLPFAYLLYVIASLAATTDLLREAPLESLKAVYTTVGIGVVVYYFVTQRPTGSLTSTRVVGALLVACSIQAAMSIADGLVGWNLWQDQSWQREFPRAIATLASPAVLGTFLGMGIVLSVAVLVWSGPPPLRRLAVATIVLGVPGLFFTYTRGPIIATTVVVSLVLASRASTRVLAIGALMLTGAVLMLSWGRIAETTTYAERITNKRNVEARFFLQKASFELATERPVFGWGYASFDTALSTVRFDSGVIPRDVALSHTSHNTYLTILVQYGIVGLALLLVPWAAILGRGLKDAMIRDSTRWLLTGSVGAIAVYAVTTNAFDVRFFSFLPAVTWLLLALLRRDALVHSSE